MATYYSFEQLNHVLNAIEVETFPERLISSGQLLPISREIPSWAETYTMESLTSIGEAAILSHYADDIPNVDVSVERRTANIFTIASSFTHSIAEIERSQALGTPLSTARAVTCRSVIEQKLDDIGYLGSSAFNLYGLLNYPNIPQTFPVADGVGGLTTLASKVTTPEKMLRDLNNFAAGMRSATLGVEVPRVICMSPDEFDLLTTTMIGADYEESVYSVFMRNQALHPQGVRYMIPVPALKGAGVGGTNMAVAFNPVESRIKFHICDDFKMHEPEYHNLKYKNPCTIKTAGVQVIKPLSVRFLVGI